MLVTKDIEIDMGHRVSNHKSKCKNLHGHRYKIEVGVDDKLINFSGASDEGMVIDFSDLKKIMMKQIDEVYDHSFTMYNKDDFADYFIELRNIYEQKINIVPFIPTAENLARHWYKLIEKELFKVGISIKYVKVWETPTSTAIYTKENDLEWVEPNQKTLFETPVL